MHRYVILAIGSFDYIESKTGNMLIRYQPDKVVAIIDPQQEGKTAKEVLGWGGSIPCIKTFKDAKQFSPTHLVVGNAPPGGILDEISKNEIHNAIQSGCDILSGMHSFLNDDPDLLRSSMKNNVKLIDLRKPGYPPKFPKGSWKKRNFPVLLIVGSDCDTGKMTTAWELTQALKKRNRKVEFIGTGQTGILLSGSGVPIDAVISDFMAGEIEYCLDQLPSNIELAIVEGQGAINNMFYSGVTLGLLHGCMPDYLIFTHEPNRTVDVASHPIPDLRQLMNLYLDLMRPFKESKYIGVNLLTLKQNDNTSKKIKESLSRNLNLPVTDIVRWKEEEFIDDIEKSIFG
ncbi:MAG: hypothetical protein CMG55_10135 [Candidatus Marinimicrobia bacterium]|nr:hypothetical protein [Candidatus Neomarinimicrobiota bacterium]